MFDAVTWSSPGRENSILWDGSFSSIAFTSDLSTFIFSTAMPEPPPDEPGLYLGKRGEQTLLTLSDHAGWWGTAFWGSPQFAFAASSLDDGTFGVSLDGELVWVGNGYWKLAPSPDGSYLVGYMNKHPSHVDGNVSGLRVFDGLGNLLKSTDDPVICIRWNADSSVLAYQAGNQLYLCEAASQATRLVSQNITQELEQEECSVKWVGESSHLEP
jgi:hypothetical protein